MCKTKRASIENLDRHMRVDFTISCSTVDAQNKSAFSLIVDCLMCSGNRMEEQCLLFIFLVWLTLECFGILFTVPFSTCVLGVKDGTEQMTFCEEVAHLSAKCTTIPSCVDGYYRKVLLIRKNVTSHVSCVKFIG